MDFLYDDEQNALREAVKGLVGKAYGDYESRRQAVNDDPGFDEKQWTKMAEMGLLGLPFSEEDGGVGAGPVEIGIVCQELGRVIAPEPYLTSVVLAGGLVSACGTAEQRQELLGALSAGESVLAFAHDEPFEARKLAPQDEPRPLWTATAEQVTAAQDGDSWTLTGVKEPVPHGARADVLIVSAALAEGGTGLFVVSGEDAERAGYPTYDGTRAARVAFDGTAATPLGEPGRRPDQQHLDGPGHHPGDGRQPGARCHAVPAAHHHRVPPQPQAVRRTAVHLPGTHLPGRGHVRLARADPLDGRLGHDGGAPQGDPVAVADAARRVSVQVSRAGRHIGQEAIQLHGGIAMTMEYSVGMYTAHLTALDHLLGDGGHHLRELAGAVTTYEALDPLD